MKTPLEMRNQLIRDYGNQAYHFAVEMVVVAVDLKDTAYARLVADAVQILRREGFHRYPKKESPV